VQSSDGCAVRCRRFVLARSRPCIRVVLEPRAGYPPLLLLRARVSVSCTDLGVLRAARLFPSAGGMPLQEVARRMRVLYERVAGIDVHKDMIKVGIRSPGDKAWTRRSEVLEYRTFYGVLQQMAADLSKRGVTHVVMEASGVCTEPVYYALAGRDFDEVAVISPAHARALKGHKTDARDCLRVAELFGCGLLRGSCIPAAGLKEVRDLTRYRMKTVQARTSEIQRLARALESAGIKLGSVASGLTGKSATAMIEALIDGERRGGCWPAWRSAGCAPPGSCPTCPGP
jgi:hypothetical protein